MHERVVERAPRGGHLDLERSLVGRSSVDVDVAAAREGAAAVGHVVRGPDRLLLEAVALDLERGPEEDGAELQGRLVELELGARLVDGHRVVDERRLCLVGDLEGRHRDAERAGEAVHDEARVEVDDGAARVGDFDPDRRRRRRDEDARAEADALAREEAVLRDAALDELPRAVERVLRRRERGRRHGRRRRPAARGLDLGHAERVAGLAHRQRARRLVEERRRARRRTTIDVDVVVAAVSPRTRGAARDVVVLLRDGQVDHRVLAGRLGPRRQAQSPRRRRRRRRRRRVVAGIGALVGVVVVVVREVDDVGVVGPRDAPATMPPRPSRRRCGRRRRIPRGRRRRRRPRRPSIRPTRRRPRRRRRARDDSELPAVLRVPMRLRPVVLVDLLGLERRRERGPKLAHPAFLEEPVLADDARDLGPRAAALDADRRQDGVAPRAQRRREAVLERGEGVVVPADRLEPREPVRVARLGAAPAAPSGVGVVRVAVALGPLLIVVVVVVVGATRPSTYGCWFVAGAGRRDGGFAPRSRGHP
mmetsp:Transcript_20890/g.83250  ORF Transcript_20890/g.83250 Transcript_20890/m.83250 type:complete len:535 (+) Transcript_20890:417-2021(+)